MPVRLRLAALALTAVPAYADPTACATTVNSKGVETTVCNPGEPSQADPVCRTYTPGSDLRALPYVKVCVAP
ncbi:MAG TPA: hypothetical protein VGX28_11260 [Frankiaceae bacterium]|jgi:hypothetical protein|nr:hypothetical protein [Frankiaceae bacterium]